MRLAGRRGQRRPRLRDVGHEPDYRFSLANERTFLAWMRTALALDAGGLVVVQLFPEFGVPGGRKLIGAALVVLGTVIAATSYRRWERNERAMREDRPLPPSRLPIVLLAGVVGVSLVALVLVALAEV